MIANYKNVEMLLKSEEVSNYKIFKDTGIAQSTLSDYSSGKSKIGNMKFEHAIILSNYWEAIKMKEQIKQAIEYGLSIDWVKAVTGQDAVDEAIETLEEMYVDTDLTVEQFVFEKLQEDGRVKDEDAFDDEPEANEQGYYWYDEVSKWIDVE